MKNRLFSLSVIFVSILLTGCGQQSGTILENVQIGPKVEGLSTGARQRLITSTTPGVASVPGSIHPTQILCVEPSPDVAIAVANQVSAGVSVFGYGSGSVSGSTAEGIAQLAERTVAIQALLKQGYQACLDYANGAITGTTYSQRTSRLDDLMVTLILAENASGAFGRAGASIGGKASGSASASLTQLDRTAAELSDLQEKLTEVESKVATADADVAAAQLALDTAATSDKETKQTELNAKKALQSKANAERRAILSQLNASAETLANSSAEISNIVGSGGISSQPNAEIARVLGDMQRRFIDKDIDQSYVSTCLVELGRRNSASSSNRAFHKMAQQGLELKYGNKKPRTSEDNKDQTSENNPVTFVNKLEENKTEKATMEGQIAKSDYQLHLEQFYLSNALVSETQLTKHCRENVSLFVEDSIRNRHELKLKTLEIEQAKLALLAKQAEKPSTKIFHPKLAMARLQTNITAYDAEKAKYNTTVVKVPKAPNPDPNSDIRGETKVIVKAFTTLDKEITAATATPQIKVVDDIEARYLSLVSDTRQEGTTLERKSWKADLDTQQAAAETKDAALSKLSAKVRDMTAKLKDLTERLVKTFKI